MGKMHASARFFGALGDVDAIVDEVYEGNPITYTFDKFFTTYGLHSTSSLKFITNKMVLRIDGTISAGNGLDWYESRLARPDWAVEGLARQLHGDTSKTFKYFRNIANGETPQTITESMCTTRLPVCEED